MAVEFRCSQCRRPIGHACVSCAKAEALGKANAARLALWPEIIKELENWRKWSREEGALSASTDALLARAKEIDRE